MFWLVRKQEKSDKYFVRISKKKKNKSFRRKEKNQEGRTRKGEIHPFAVEFAELR